MLRIYLYNDSMYTNDTELRVIAGAINFTLATDFSPKWGKEASIIVLPKGETIEKEGWLVRVMDSTDQEGALGYHDEPEPWLISSKVFAQTIAEDEGTLSEVISHEVFEMLVDPFANFLALDPASGHLIATEVCDAVEGNGYLVNGILIADWVKPNWYNPETLSDEVTNFNPQHVVRGPWALGKYGYASFLDLKHPNKGWKSVYGSANPLISKSGPHADRIIRRMSVVPGSTHVDN